MILVDYLLITALITTALVGIYFTLLRWLRTPTVDFGEAGKTRSGSADLSRMGEPARLRGGLRSRLSVLNRRLSLGPHA